MTAKEQPEIRPMICALGTLWGYKEDGGAVAESNGGPGG